MKNKIIYLFVTIISVNASTHENNYGINGLIFIGAMSLGIVWKKRNILKENPLLFNKIKKNVHAIIGPTYLAATFYFISETTGITKNTNDSWVLSTGLSVMLTGVIEAYTK